MSLDQERVVVLDNRIVYIRELEKPSPQTISESASRVREIAKGWEDFAIVVEFPKDLIPDPDTRHQVISEMSMFKGKLNHVAVVAKHNVFIKLTVRFIGTFIGFRQITMHADKDEALKEIMTRRTRR